ncbi:hypothetical protein [Leptospira semungkisensis]|uniref:hypothetical protein n=1 Tax=Leptospira semungkisensis TaxID=2484985 RepID=UPI001FE40743|nr:hypothetical protein [Leptospira semungkisensis]
MTFGKSILAATLLQNCAFGNLGNATEERSEIFQSFLRLVDERRTNISPWIYYSDDQGDTDLSSFQISGNSTNYSVSIAENTLVLKSLYFLFQAPDTLFGLSHSNQADFHSLHSGGSEGSGSVGTGSYAKRYGIRGSFESGDISISDFESLTGPVKSQNLSPFPPVPYGSISHIYGEYSAVFLDLIITRISDSSTRKIHIELRDVSFQIEPSCNLETPYKQSVPLSLGFRVDGLLKSRPSSSFSLLDSVYSLGISELTINDFQNSNLYSEILNNLGYEGQTLVFYSCL